MTLTVIVPARNAFHVLPQCLTAIRNSGNDGIELLVVDDASTDATADVARSFGATVLRHPRRRGPAAARNRGARAATGEVLLFVDADVRIAADVIPRVRAAFDGDAGLAAVFGSYDAAPAAGRFVSDYRNLLHHFTHQHSHEASGSFWAGCGAVRRSVFVQLQGFDERYRRPSIEDIEFGDRCRRAGYRIWLDKRMQGTHLKSWTLLEILRVDIRDRAYPWARLALRRGRLPADLNLQWSHRVSAALVWVAASAAVTAAGVQEWRSFALGVAVTSVVAVLWLNRVFYRWLTRERGLGFLLKTLPLHLGYYAYASATFGWAWVRHGLARLFEARPTRPRVDSNLAS